jgi:hypothetical protein
MDRDPEEFFVWDCDPGNSNTREPLRVRNIRSFDEFEFKNGVRHARTPPCMELEIASKRVLTDYLFNVLGYPLFSPRLRAALMEAGIEDIEYSPARLVTQRGRLVRDDYMVGNVLGLVTCFDWERSRYDPTYRPYGLADRIEKLVLDMGALAGHRLCRMQENPGVLLVAGSLRVQLLDEGMTGIVFIPIDDYSQ